MFVACESPRVAHLASLASPDITDVASGKKLEVLVDKTTGSLSLTVELPNYESLIVPNDEITCDLGAPVLGGGLSNTGQPDVTKIAWVGHFPNGVGGVCRMFDMDTIEATGKKDTLSYLDAAALCAKGGGRLPLLSELEAAASIASAPTAEGTTSTPARKDNAHGWTEGTGKYPLRAMNVKDAWLWPNDDKELSIILDSQNGCRASETCPDKDVTDTLGQPVNVWTYNGEQATIGAQGDPNYSTEADLYKDPTGTGAVVTAVPTVLNPQEKLPVLCYLGKDYVNEKFKGDKDTKNGWTNKASKPSVGFSVLVKSKTARMLEGGKMFMAEKKWKLAYDEFFNGFKKHSETANPRANACLKYVVLANMLSLSKISPLEEIFHQPPGKLDLKSSMSVLPCTVMYCH